MSNHLLGRAAQLALAGYLLTSHAAATPDRDFALGQGATGAVCQAVQEFDDPAIQLRGARAWSIHCRGYTALFGRLYSFSRSGPQSIADGSLWRTALGQRAKCEAPQAATVAGVKNAQRAVCQSVPGNVPYSVYTLEDGD